MTLPIDRTTLTAAQGNQVPSTTAASAKNINAIAALFNTVDELYSFVTGLLSSSALSRLGWKIATDYSGVDSTGTADSTTGIQAAFTAAAGNVAYLPPGDYKISSMLSLPANTTLIAYGARIFNTSTHITLLSLAAGAKVYGLELEGAGNASYNSSGRGVEFKGSYDSGLATINYAVDAILQDCYIHDIGAIAVYTEYAKYLRVKNCKIEDVGYAGLVGLSVQNVHVSNETKIVNMGPGTSGNAYGVSFGRDETTGDTTRYPRSKDCSVTKCYIEGNAVWEALDTHAGDGIDFEGNTIRDCKIGIAMVPSKNVTTDLIAPSNCKARGNKIYGLGTGIGITLAGAFGTLGNPTEYAQNCEISGNYIYNGGIQGGDTTGAINCIGTRGTVIANNEVDRAKNSGICMYHTNIGFVIIGNTITDPNDTTFSVAPGIQLRSGYNKGVIEGNVFLRVNTGLNTYVGIIAIYSGELPNTDIQLGKNYNTMPTYVSGFYLKEKTGSATFSGDGVTTTFTIAHGMGTTPSYFNVVSSSGASAVGIDYVLADATNLTVKFKTAPGSGSSNVVVKWEARV